MLSLFPGKHLQEIEMIQVRCFLLQPVNQLPIVKPAVRSWKQDLIWNHEASRHCLSLFVETNSWKEFKCRSTGRRNRNGGMKLIYTVNGARMDGWVKHGRPRLIGKEKFQLNQLGERDDKTSKGVTETRTRTRTSAPACLCPAGWFASHPAPSTPPADRLLSGSLSTRSPQRVNSRCEEFEKGAFSWCGPGTT